MVQPFVDLGKLAEAKDAIGAAMQALQLAAEKVAGVVDRTVIGDSAVDPVHRAFRALERRIIDKLAEAQTQTQIAQINPNSTDLRRGAEPAPAQ